MDAYSSYNQILMYEPNQEVITFVTNRSIYCYKFIPFRMKNASPTYQLLVITMFKEQSCGIMEVYIDDMVVKEERPHGARRGSPLCYYGMRLNLVKCTFGFPSETFLGFIITKRWIEACPNQIKAILDMHSPHNIWEIQKF